MAHPGGIRSWNPQCEAGHGSRRPRRRNIGPAPLTSRLQNLYVLSARVWSARPEQLAATTSCAWATTGTADKDGSPQPGRPIECTGGALRDAIERLRMAENGSHRGANPTMKSHRVVFHTMR
jgi:hypothetical protein